MGEVLWGEKGRRKRGVTIRGKVISIINVIYVICYACILHILDIRYSRHTEEIGADAPIGSSS